MGGLSRTLAALTLAILSIAIFSIGVAHAISVTLHGTLYVVYSNGTKVPFTKVVKRLQYYTLRVFYYPSMVPVVTSASRIFPNSTYVITGLQNGKSYVIYLYSPKGRAPLMQYNVMLGKYSKIINIPPFVSGVLIDLYINYSQLLPIMYVVYVPVLKYKILKTLPNVTVLGQRYDVKIEICNLGNATGTAVLVALLDSNTIFAKIVKVEPGASEIVDIPVIVNKTGTHILVVSANGTIILREVFKTIKIVRLVKIKPTIIAKPPKVVPVGLNTSIIVELVNLGNASGIAYLRLLVNGITVRLVKAYVPAGGEVVEKIPLIFNKSGIYRVELYLNRTLIFTETVKAVYYTLILNVRSVSAYINQTVNIPVVSLNSTSDIEYLNLAISYNNTLLHVVNIESSSCTGPLEYIIKGSIIYVNITQPRCRNILTLTFKAVKAGQCKINITGTGKLENGAVARVESVGGMIKVSKVLECDFNGNGRLDIGDVVLALKYVVTGIKPPVPCDLNHNGKLDIGDVVLLLLKILQGMIT